MSPSIISHLPVVSGYKRAGPTLALLSLLPPALASARYYMVFIALTTSFLQRNLLAYALLRIFTFIVLTVSFHKLEICQDSESFCVYAAFGNAALSSAPLFLLSRAALVKRKYAPVNAS